MVAVLAITLVAHTATIALNPSVASAATADAIVYVLVNGNSSRAVEVAGLSAADGAVVVQESDWDGSDQQWQLVRIAPR